MRPASVPKVKALQCPNCGGTVEVRGHANTINAVCIQCLSVIDTSNPTLQVLQRFEESQRRQPLIPLGTRGKFEGTSFDAIGFQVRAIEVDGEIYEWSEYLLYNPYKGYRYLSEYQGHWNFIRPLRALPQAASRGKKKAARIEGRVFTHFQTAQANSVYVMGEFPWQVRVGETVIVEDYVDPPHLASAEATNDEVTWSVGQYTSGKEIWQAFGLKGDPPRPQGIFANQPSPHTGKASSAWKTFALLLTLFFVALIGTFLLRSPIDVFRQSYHFSPTAPGERSFVTSMFDFTGSSSNVEVTITTDLNNSWAFFGLALINDGTGVAYDSGKEVSYYTGRDSDGNWTEGNRRESVVFPNVPAGRYYLRVEPEMPADAPMPLVNYELSVTRGVPALGWFIPVFILLLIPPIWISWRAFSFENTRWAESDYGAMVSSSEED